MSDNREAVSRALRAWAQAIRGDWDSIDGRTCRDELERLADFLTDDAPEVTYEYAAWEAGVCPVHRMWPDNCPGDFRDQCPDFLVAASTQGETP